MSDPAAQTQQSAIVMGVFAVCTAMTGLKFLWLYYNPTMYMTHPKAPRNLFVLLPFVSFFHETMVMPSTWGDDRTMIRAREAFWKMFVSMCIQTVFFIILLALLTTRP